MIPFAIDIRWRKVAWPTVNRFPVCAKVYWCSRNIREVIKLTLTDTVSTITPALNHAHTLSETLPSNIHQTQSYGNAATIAQSEVVNSATITRLGLINPATITYSGFMNSNNLHLQSTNMVKPVSQPVLTSTAATSEAAQQTTNAAGQQAAFGMSHKISHALEEVEEVAIKGAKILAFKHKLQTLQSQRLDILIMAFKTATQMQELEHLLDTADGSDAQFDIYKQKFQMQVRLLECQRQMEAWADAVNDTLHRTHIDGIHEGLTF